MIATIIAFATLQFADLATTIAVLSRGVGRETNPVGVAILAHGLGMAVVLKAALVVAVALYMIAPTGHRQLRFGIVQGMSVAMAFVVLSNVGIAVA